MDKNKKGLKQQVKSGELSPDEAIKQVKKSSVYSERFVKWADTVGRRRYKQSSETEPVTKKKSKKS